MQSVGVIRQIARYPVKSMRGESLPASKLTLQGVPEDRRYAFVQAASRSSFPWLTARELPQMLCYRTAVEENGSEPVVTVIAPGGERSAVDSPELKERLEAQSCRPLFLLRDYRGSYDVAPVSLISRQTVARIAEESETAEDAWRFRPNLLIDLEHGEGFEELNWVGRILRIGETARVALTEVDLRCMLITLDPQTGIASPAVLRCVVQQHQQRAGVYGTVLSTSEVRVGDRLSLET